MPGFLAQIRAINQNLSLNQKLSILTLGAVVLFGVLGFVYLIRQNGYRTLVDNADASTVEQVIEYLRQNDIPFETSSDGRAVLVPTDHFGEADRGIRANKLYDQGQPGMEMFDESDWSMTTFGEKVKLKRALEGELARTIMRHYAAVESTRVHVTMKQDSLYLEKQEPAKASVNLTLRGSQSLMPEQVLGIQAAVAQGVPGLEPKNVTVIGPMGILSRTETDSSMLNERQLNLREKMEHDLTRKALAILQPVEGLHKVEVITNLDLDFQEVQQSERLLDPVLLSEERSIRPGPGADSASGVPGLASNLGADPANNSQPPQGAASTETRNYNFSTIERQQNSPGGRLRGITMSVVIDNKTVIREDDKGKKVEVREAWPEDELQKLRELVAAAVSLKPERGDKLTFMNIPFQEEPVRPPTVVEPGFFEQYQHLLTPALRYLGILLLFALFYLLIFRPVKRRVFAYVEFKDPEFAQLASAQPAGQSTGAQKQLAGGQRLALGQGGSPTEKKEPSEEEKYQQQVMELAQSKPEVVTDLVREWLAG